MRRLTTLLFACAGLGFFTASAQCIDKFPYTYDFENFKTLQTVSVCNTAYGAYADGWTQDNSDDGEWRADTAGTGSVGTGPGSTDTTNGIGVGTDYSPGKTTGVYLYTEATETNNGCKGSVVNLLSPCFDFSGTSYYQLSFAYHMHGSGMGSLSVDVYDGSKWVTDVWSISGDQGENWQVAKVGLGHYTGSAVQIRIRAVVGLNYLSDCAIDAVTVETYTPNDYDANLVTARWYNDDTYFYVPEGHYDSIRYDVRMTNDGIKDITAVKVITRTNSQSDTASLGTVKPGQRDTLTAYHSYFPKLGDEESVITLILNEADGNTSNNEIRLPMGINDTIYSRDDGEYVGGVGNNNGVIEMGNVYELRRDDTLTTVSFFINGGAAGDSTRAKLYRYSAGTVGSLIATSDYITVTGNEQWYTTALKCDQHLTKGEYFIAVEQTSSNNLGLGYDSKYYVQGKGMYNVGTGWTDFSASSLFINILVRMNFGEVKYPDVQVAIADSICQGVEYQVNATGALTYTWEPFGIVRSKTGKSVVVESDTSFRLKVTGTDQCGKQTVWEKDIVVKKRPDLEVSNDTTICEKEQLVLKAKTYSPYAWTGGPSNSDYTVSPTSSTTYKVKADSSNGCSNEDEVYVVVSKPTPKVNNDTTVCEAQAVVLKASGGTSYQWQGAPAAGASYTVYPRKNTDFVVEVKDGYNCSAFDTVSVSITPGPALTTSNDTAVCFGQRVLLMAYGADTYEWTGGPSTPTYNALPISSRSYYVKGIATNGCSLIDSVVVTVANIPQVSLRSDTTICEGNTLNINAEGVLTNVKYQWNTGDTSRSIQVSPMVTARYKVVVSNSTGCSSEDSVMITVDPLPVIDFSFSQNHKNITIINNTANGDTHLWKFGDGDSSMDKSTTHRYDKHGFYDLSYMVSNKCGSRDTMFTVEVENISVKDLAIQGLTIFPNPTQGQLFVRMENDQRGPVAVTVVDVTGKVIYRRQFEKSTDGFEGKILLEDVSPGTYLISVGLNEGISTRRITIH